uniref:Uncharacterized protein n=1 Tax=Cebus imitator TaxID=2715852 RepID=A0A2K5RQB6_CEBIM
IKLASVLERPLPVNQPGFFGLGGRADLLDLGPGSPSDGLTLAVPGWGPGIEMLHGTTTLAFKFSQWEGGLGILNCSSYKSPRPGPLTPCHRNLRVRGC